MTRHVVIAGAGFGGLAAARALARAPVRVTLVDRMNHHVFQPLLYQVATAALSPAQIATPIRTILRRQKNADVVLGDVVGVDGAARALLLECGPLPYDDLVLATGSRTAYFGHDDWADAAPGLKTIEDALAIRGRVLLAFELADREPDPGRRAALLTFVCIGGGPTGVEMAGAIAEIARATLRREYRNIDPRQARVLLIEGGPRILGTFAEPLSQAAHERLTAMGVEIRTGNQVRAIEPGAVTVREERIPSHAVIWSAGVAATPVAAWLGVPAERGGRVRVCADLTVPGRADVFVIGDAAHCEQDGRPLPGVAPVAKQMGRYAARVIAARASGAPPPPPFRYADKGSLATVGRSFAVADLRGRHLTGLLAWLAWLAVHVTYLIGFRNRLLVLFEWAWAYVTFQRGARLITGSRKTLDRPS